MAVNPIPEGMHTITPHLVINGAAKAIDFYKRAFGAQEIGRHTTPDGKVMHALLQIGDSRLMLADEFPGPGCLKSAQTLGGTAVVINLYVPDVDAVWRRATEAGAQIAYPLSNQFWGDRYGQLTDPFGQRWAVATHVEDVSHDELAERAKAAFAQMTK
jgi:uncharacterized glyoxalase superfamily protein PhnB